MTKRTDQTGKDVKNTKTQTGVSRRKFLASAALATGGAAATLGFPAILKAQGPISMRWQSTWPTKDIFHEYALDFAKKVNDMTGGDLKIEVLPAGAVVPAFNLLDAVSKGTLDGGHGVLVYHYGKQKPWPCGARAQLSAWMPTCCSPGTSTAAARSCSQRSMRPSAPTWYPSSTARWRPSPWAGSRSLSPRWMTSRA